MLDAGEVLCDGAAVGRSERLRAVLVYDSDGSRHGRPPPRPAKQPADDGSSHGHDRDADG
jgi:hypothetical protein